MISGLPSLRRIARSASDAPPLNGDGVMTKNNDGAWDKSNLPGRHFRPKLHRASSEIRDYAMGFRTRKIAQPFLIAASC